MLQLVCIWSRVRGSQGKTGGNGGSIQEGNQLLRVFGVRTTFQHYPILELNLCSSTAVAALDARCP